MFIVMHQHTKTNSFYVKTYLAINLILKCKFKSKCWVMFKCQLKLKCWQKSELSKCDKLSCKVSAEVQKNSQLMNKDESSETVS